jgi:outer membrane protein assembly factor BamA
VSVSKYIKFFFIIALAICTQLIATDIRFNEYFETDLDACIATIFAPRNNSSPVVFLHAVYIDEIPASVDCTKEMEYYFSSKIHTTLTEKKFIEGMWCLHSKKRFDCVNIVLQGNTVELHLSRAWLLERVYIKGVLFGRNQYAQFYPIRPGDPFAEESHAMGLARIREALYAQGYCDSDVVDQCVYNKVNKSIRVYLHITLSKRFVFGSVDFDIESDCCSKVIKAELIEHINKKYCRKIVGSLYKKEFLEQIAENIREYVLKKGFYDSTLEIKPVICYCSKQVQVKFLLHVSGYKCIEFFGNTFFSTHELFTKVVPYPQMIGAVVAYAGMRELEELYHEYGFFDAEITTQNGEKHIVFILHEGCRYRVANVCIQTDSDERLDDKIIDTALYRAKLVNSFIDSPSIDAMRSELLELFLHQGYWDCTVDVDVKPSLSQKTLSVTFSIHQGVQRSIGTMTFDDDISGVSDVLIKKHPYLAGEHEIFDAEYLHAIERTIIEYAKSSGIIRLRIVPNLSQTETGVVSVHWKSGGVSRASIGEKVVLAGLSKIKAARMYAHLGMQENGTEVWQSNEAMQKRTRLIKLGVFDRVDIHSQYVDAIERPLAIVTLHDAPSLHYGIKGGLYCSGSNFAFKNFSYKTGGECAWKNITKHADYGVFVANLTRYRRDVHARYVYPWASALYTLTECRAYSSRYDQPLCYGSADTLYHDARDGAMCSISADCYSGHWVFESGYEQYKISHLCKEKAIHIGYCPQLVNTSIKNFCAEYSFVYNGVDDPFSPRRGLSASLIATMRMPFNAIYNVSIKGIAESSFYIPCYAATFAARMRIGHIANQKFCCISPSDRFYLGGGNSIRGYEVDQVPPLTCMYDDKGKRRLVAIGGKTMISTNVECRLPIRGNLQGSLFFDSGMLLQDETLQFSCAADSLYAVSYGFGLLYITPLGPIRFDFGWKGRRVDTIESKFVWHFSFGYAF